MDKPSIDEVMDALNALDYPASKQDVVRHAEQAGAGESVLKALRSLPLADSRSREEIRQSVPVAEDDRPPGVS